MWAKHCCSWQWRLSPRVARRKRNRFWNARCAALPMDWVVLIRALKKPFSWRRLAPGEECHPSSASVCRYFRSLVGSGTLRFLGGGLVGTHAGENAGKCVIAFVAGVLEDPPFRRAEFVFAAPRPIPNARILDLELIKDAVRCDASESLGDLQL